MFQKRFFLLLLMVVALASSVAQPVWASSNMGRGSSSQGGDVGLEGFVEPPQISQEEILRKAKQMSFDNALDGAMPLSPEQIAAIIQKMSIVQEAAAPAIANPVRPKPVLKVETISLDPGTQPPVIKVAAGYVTSVMILDATGAPWEIKDIAYVGKFNAAIPNSAPHTFRILPLNRFYEGNLTLQLVGLATPVTFRLEAGEDEVYYRYDVRLPVIGPNAKAPQFKSANSMVAGDSVMMAVLSGYPPASSKRLQVSGLDDRSAAWEINGQIFLRTPHTLLSPAWSGSTTSGDGTTVYAIPDTPVLLLSDQGVMVRARLSRPKGIVEGEAQ